MDQESVVPVSLSIRGVTLHRILCAKPSLVSIAKPFCNKSPSEIKNAAILERLDCGENHALLDEPLNFPL